MQIGEVVRTKLGMAVILNKAVYGTKAMRCLLIHHSKAMHCMDEIEVMDGSYASPWGPVIILPEFIESSTGRMLVEQDMLDLAWLTRIRDEGYHYEKWGPHPLAKFRCDEQIGWNPIHIPSVFSSLNEMEEGAT